MPEERPSIMSHPLKDRLTAAARDRNEDAFAAAVEAVLHEPDETAVGLLAPHLGEPGPIGRLAAHGLLMLGMPSLEALLSAVEGEDATARAHAAWALGSLPDPRSGDALMALAEAATDPALQRVCLGSLAELSDRRQVSRLVALLKSPAHQAVRGPLCQALGHTGDTTAVPHVAPLLESESAEERLRAAEALIRLLDKRGWPVLYEVLRGEDTQGDSMVATLRDLGDLSSALTSFVGDDQYHLRRDAAELLGTFGEVQAVPALIEALRDINPWVRGASAHALGRLADKRAVKGLVVALDDSSAWVRLCAVSALAMIGDPKAVKPLERSLFDPDPEVAAAAQEAIGTLTMP